MRRWSWLLVLPAIAGCMVQQMGAGAGLAPDQRAIVRSDPALSAGLPVQVRLRSVDDLPVRVGSSAVALAPGRHRLLVDCKVLETGATARFAIQPELEAGGDYRLVARASALNCEAVEIVPR